MRHAAHGQGNAVAGEIDVDDAHSHILSYSYHLGGRCDKGVGELRHMDEPVVWESDVDKGSEGSSN